MERKPRVWEQETDPTPPQYKVIDEIDAVLQASKEIREQAQATINAPDTGYEVGGIDTLQGDKNV